MQDTIKFRSVVCKNDAFIGIIDYGGSMANIPMRSYSIENLSKY